jgi:hypothetical protein
MKVNFNVLNQKASPAIYASSLATRPAASFAGRIFIDTDSSSTGIYRDTGTAWVHIASLGSGTTPNLQQVTDVGNNTTNDIRLDFVGEQQAGLFVYDTGNFQNKLFFGIDANGVGQVEYFVSGAINTNMGFSFGNNSTIYSFYGDNSRIGFILDFNGNTYFIGDPDKYINGTALIVDDVNQQIQTQFYNSFGIQMSPQSVRIGDYDATANSTYIEISDVNQRLNVSSNLLSASSGSNSSQHLCIWVNGTQYKIQLKNP